MSDPSAPARRRRSTSLPAARRSVLALADAPAPPPERDTYDDADLPKARSRSPEFPERAPLLKALRPGVYRFSDGGGGAGAAGGVWGGWGLPGGGGSGAGPPGGAFGSGGGGSCGRGGLGSRGTGGTGGSAGGAPGSPEGSSSHDGSSGFEFLPPLKGVEVPIRLSRLPGSST